MKVSVIICTHNPREDYLRRTLEALGEQTLSKDCWELLVIDNASQDPVSFRWDLGWHPHAHHLREDELGLTPARLRGVRESTGELLVFVDDDNLLDETYLREAREIACRFPWLGAFGGRIVPIYETPPASWAAPVLPELAIREVEHAAWAMAPGAGAWAFAPLGAGMVIRSAIARDYLRRCEEDAVRQGLDRKGGSLISCGDIDMALCSCLNGYGVGLFPELSLGHLIPAGRLEREYLLRLTEGIAESHVLLAHLYDEPLPTLPGLKCRSERLLDWWRRLRASEPSAEQRFMEEVLAARARGRERGVARVRELKSRWGALP